MVYCELMYNAVFAVRYFEYEFRFFHVMYFGVQTINYYYIIKYFYHVDYQRLYILFYFGGKGFIYQALCDSMLNLFGII